MPLYDPQEPLAHSKASGLAPEHDGLSNYARELMQRINPKVIDAPLPLPQFIARAGEPFRAPSDPVGIIGAGTRDNVHFISSLPHRVPVQVLEDSIPH